MEVSVSAALGYIQTFMHPQVVIIDDSSREDGFFTKAIRAKAMEIGRSVIELPKDASESLMWITRLDSGSLSGNPSGKFEIKQLLTSSGLAWHTTYVDILIHAPPDSSGSLLRLLKSIEAADYFGHRRPHLTIELPAEVDPPTWAYLQQLTWPPLDWSGGPHVSQVTLRHHLRRAYANPEEASLRHVESFYPARQTDSHVLVLSPQIELSPLYFQFLMYYLLEYKYSSSTSQFFQMQSLLGLSLELPRMHLNDTTPFSPPKPSKKPKGDEKESSTPFLWQAPNSDAALYFGDKWIEFHSFLTSRIAVDQTKQPVRRKLISEIYPAWLEYLQELMRARGYTLLYPNLPSSSSNRNPIANLHYELYQPPEEFSKPKPTSKTDTPIPTLDPKTETFTTDPSIHRPKYKESKPLTSNLHSLLPPRPATLNQFPSELPVLSHDGNEVDISVLEFAAHTFASDFRRQIGLCPATHKPVPEPMKADDLFCNRDEDLRAGLGLGEVGKFDEVQSSVPKEPEKPVVKDDDGVRQSEFEEHLNRQGGEKGGKGKGEKGKGKGGTPVNNVVGKEKEEKAEEKKGKEVDTKEAAEEKPRGW